MPLTQKPQTSDLFAALDSVVLVRGKNKSYVRPARAPEWFDRVCPNWQKSLTATDWTPFLATFETQCQAFWQVSSKDMGTRRSGWWTHVDPDGVVHYFRATAVRFSQVGYLVISHETGDSEVFTTLARYEQGLVELDRAWREHLQCTLALEDLKKKNVSDDLTGLLNRQGFLSGAAGILEKNKQEERLFLLFSVGVDNLAELNEKYGHTEGTMALLGAAGILKQVFEDKEDVLARSSGGEFLVLASESAYRTRSVLANQIQEKLKQYNLNSFKTYELSLSLGSSGVSSLHVENLEDEIKKAVSNMMAERKASKKE